MSCDKCSDRGYILTDGREWAGFCDCDKGVNLKKSMWEKTLASVGVPKEYFEKELEHLYPQVSVKHKQFVERVSRAVENIDLVINSSSLWAIYGDSGTGKSLGAILILKEMLRKGKSCKYIMWTTLLDKRLNPSPEEPNIIDALRKVDLLVIDDIGKDSMRTDSKYPNETLERIIKNRYSNQKPSILIFSDEYDVVANRLPVCRDLFGTDSITEVRGLNYRLR